MFDEVAGERRDVDSVASVFALQHLHASKFLLGINLCFSLVNFGLGTAGIGSELWQRQC